MRGLSWLSCDRLAIVLSLQSGPVPSASSSRCLQQRNTHAADATRPSLPGRTDPATVCISVRLWKRLRSVSSSCFWEGDKSSSASGAGWIWGGTDMRERERVDGQREEQTGRSRWEGEQENLAYVILLIGLRHRANAYDPTPLVARRSALGCPVLPALTSRRWPLTILCSTRPTRRRSTHALDSRPRLETCLCLSSQLERTSRPSLLPALVSTL